MDFRDVSDLKPKYRTVALERLRQWQEQEDEAEAARER